MRNLLVLIAMIIPSAAVCQEVFIDTMTNTINLSLGAMNERMDSLKTLEGDVVSWKAIRNLEQRDLLLGEQFTNEVFKAKLHFSLEGYEPFWRATITKDQATFIDLKTGETRRLAVTIYADDNGMNPKLYFMFKTSDNNVWGVVNYVGWNPRQQQKCECNISEWVSLYETYVCINGEIFRGCATIESDL